MKVRFYAHACFRLESDGRSVVTDPYTPGEVSGFEPVGEPADWAILSTGEDLFHNDPSHVGGDPEVIRSLELGTEVFTAAGLEVQAFPTRERFHWWGRFAFGWPRRNAMYLIHFPAEGIRVLHTGDVGRPFKPAHLAALEGRVDVMLAITGGVHNIEIDDLDRAIRRIRPAAVIPMHYYNPRGKIPDLLPVTAFTDRYPPESVVLVGGSDLDLDRERLAGPTRVYVLEPCR